MPGAQVDWPSAGRGSASSRYSARHCARRGRVPLTERDALQIGPYELSLLLDQPAGSGSEPAQVIRARVEAQLSNHTLFANNASYKLQVMLEIARGLGHTLDIDPLLGKLLEHLLRMFTPADRGMVLLCDGDRLVVRAQTELVERLQAALDETAQLCGFPGAILVKGDAALPTAAIALPNDPAASRIEAYNQAVIGIMKEGPRLGVKGRAARFQPVVGEYYAIPMIAQVAAGSGWASASAADRQALITELTKHSAASLASNFDRFGAC